MHFPFLSISRFMISLILLGCLVCAQAITEKDVVVAVENTFWRMQTAPIPAIEEITPIDDEKTQTLAFIVSLQPQGYVVVGADRSLPPVVAYSLNQSCDDPNDPANPLITLVKSDMLRRLAWNRQQSPSERSSIQEWESLLAGEWDVNRDQRFEQWPPEGSTSSGGWVETHWTQSYPYNQYCPIDAGSGNHSVAGCPAVAMGMIVDYHRNTHGTEFNDGDDYYHNFSGNQFWIDDDYAQWGFPSFPELNSMLAGVQDSYNHQIPLTGADKGALVFACGVAAEQVYSGTVSGTFAVNQAFQAYQRLGYDDSVLLGPDGGNIYAEMISDIQEGLPVHLALVTPDWQSGHNVIVDGYNTDDYFHINFGWGGTNDGWYLLPQEVPYGLTVVEGVVVDIIPDQILMTGDLNLDEIVNVQDIIILLNIILGQEPSQEQLQTGDVNGDSNLDVLDIVGIVNIILGVN